MCSILDGYSRSIIHWEIREQMKEDDVEVILQRAREKYPGASPRIITDNGPQFISRSKVIASASTTFAASMMCAVSSLSMSSITTRFGFTAQSVM